MVYSGFGPGDEEEDVLLMLGKIGSLAIRMTPFLVMVAREKG